MVIVILVAILCVGSGMFSSTGTLWAKAKTTCAQAKTSCAKAKTATNTTLSVEREQQFAYYFYAAHYAIDHEQYAQALMLLRLCEQINPNDGKTQDYLGLIYDALHETTAARTHFEHAYRCDQTLWGNYANALLSQQDKNSTKQAISILEQAAKRDPRNDDCLDMLQKAYVMSQQFSKALKVQDQIDKNNGYNAYSAIRRYQIYILQQKPKLAIGEIDRYLEQDPGNLRFLLFRAELLERTQHDTRALEQTYQRILQIDPNNLMILNNYAYLIAIHGGDLSMAERMSQRVIQAEPNNATYLDTYAWILHLQGQDMLAKFYIQKAIQNADDKNIEELQQHYNAIVH